jgi:hypothetical protein
MLVDFSACEEGGLVRGNRRLRALLLIEMSIQRRVRELFFEWQRRVGDRDRRAAAGEVKPNAAQYQSRS